MRVFNEQIDVNEIRDLVRNEVSKAFNVSRLREDIMDSVRRDIDSMVQRKLLTSYIRNESLIPEKIQGSAAGAVEGDVLGIVGGVAAWSSALSGGNCFASSFSNPTATGDYSVTGVGFSPKLVVFNTTIADSSSVMSMNHGWMDASGNESCVGVAFNSTTSAAATKSDTSRCITIVSSAGAYSTSASFVSMDADGFTVNYSARSTGTVYFWAYG